MVIEIKVVGADEVERYLNGVSIKIPKGADNISARIANRVTRSARGIISKGPYRFTGPNPGGLKVMERKLTGGEETKWVVTAFVEGGFDYAAAVHEGARSHDISSDKPMPMRRKGGVITNYVRGTVHHPGAQSSPEVTYKFLDKAVEKTRQEIPGIIAKEIGDAIK